MLSSNKERKMGLQPLFLSNFEKLTHGYLLFFTNIAVQFLYKKHIFQHVKDNKHSFHYKYLLICQDATNILKKREQHDINKLFNGI